VPPCARARPRCSSPTWCAAPAATSPARSRTCRSAPAGVDLALCSHLLFTWADRFDEHRHRAALTELARVARREVRVYPLVVQGTGDPVPFLDGLRADLHAAGLPSTLQPVPYRFQRGADRMLVVDTTGG
jgi:hypothetical protein